MRCAVRWSAVRVQVVWVRDGKLAKVGTYDEMRADDEFMQVIGSHVVAEDVETDKGDAAHVGEPSSVGDSGSRSTGSGIKADPVAAGKPAGAMMNAAVVEKRGLTGAAICAPHTHLGLAHICLSPLPVHRQCTAFLLTMQRRWHNLYLCNRWCAQDVAAIWHA